MAVASHELNVGTAGENSFTDLTEKIGDAVKRSGIENGIANISVLSTTSSIIVCENEKGHLNDLIRYARKVAPEREEYEHNLAWGDNNGRSHVKAALFRQDITLPVMGGGLVLGTWQSIFLVEFDLHPRKRRVVVTVIG